MKSIAMPAKLPQYAGDKERHIEAQSPISALIYALVMSVLVGALIVGFVVWEVGWNELAASDAEDLEAYGIAALLFLIAPILMGGWGFLRRGRWRGMKLRETELVLVGPSDDDDWRISWDEIVGVGYLRTRAGTSLTLKIKGTGKKGPKERVRLGTPAFDFEDLSDLHLLLLDAGG